MAAIHQPDVSSGAFYNTSVIDSPVNNRTASSMEYHLRNPFTVP